MTQARWIVLITLSGWALSGCAVLGFDSHPSEEEIYEGDPVAQAALRFRDRAPASAPLGGSAPVRAVTPDDENSEPVRDQLVLGMDMARVRSLWGQPQDVQVAGDQRSGNQKWVYHNGLSQRWGTSNSRIVYFENGRVVGWESGR